jgi:ABC-type multidrug transport system fused ATPase/permease subunit
MDEILVLGKGRIIERGSFEELLALRGVFTLMAARQSIHAPERDRPVAAV